MAILDLTIGTPTQKTLAGMAIQNFEAWQILAQELSFAFAETLVLLPDFGLSHNIRRMRNGFFTGMLFIGSNWTSAEKPLIPYGITLNSCQTSVWRIAPISSNDFLERVDACRRAMALAGGFTWNFESGNHLILLCEDGADNYLVLHGGSAEFKDQDFGLYESSRIWQSPEVAERSNRVFRFLAGERAHQLVSRCRLAELIVREKHSYVAEVLGASELICRQPHYGFSKIGLAMGGHLLTPGEQFALLSSPSDPIYVCTARGVHDGMPSPSIPLPHGLGAEASGAISVSCSGEILIGGTSLMNLNSLRQTDAKHLWHIRTVADVSALGYVPETRREFSVERKLTQVVSITRAGISSK